MQEGIIILDKPPGVTSAVAVTRIKLLLPRGMKVGHAGTLDRFATGMLIVLVGRSATRQSELVMNWSKTYEATIKLGATTATDDPDSPEQPTNALSCDSGSVARELNRFVGRVAQRPPAFCALKSAGRRISDRARHGKPSPTPPVRLVQIDRIDVLDYAWPFVRIRVDCGRGTYIRSIARDLGAALGVGGYLTELRRTRVGMFSIDEAVSIETLRERSVEPFLRSGDSSSTQ